MIKTMYLFTCLLTVFIAGCTSLETKKNTAIAVLHEASLLHNKAKFIQEQSLLESININPT